MREQYLETNERGAYVYDASTWGERQEVKNLRPQEHKLIRYMAQRNRANDEVPEAASEKPDEDRSERGIAATLAKKPCFSFRQRV